MKKITFFGTLLLSFAFIQAQNQASIYSTAPLEKTIAGSADVKTVYQSGSQNLKTTPIWGAGAPVGSENGEFAYDFIPSSGFTPGSTDTTWTAISVNDGNGSPGSAFWVHNMTGYSAGAYWSGTTPHGSPSQANGSALFDSDFMDNGGVQGNFGLGTSPSPHKGELISPAIDLTGYADVGLKIDFFSYIRSFQINELSVSMSVDGGATWTTKDYMNLTSDLTEEFVSVVFPFVTTGATNLTDVRIKFTFDGDYYFAFVDDVSISEAFAYDFAFAPANPNGTLLSDLGDQLNLTNNRYFPLSQLIAEDFYFGTNVKNYGVVTVLPSDSAQLDLTIQQFTGSWTNVYTQSTPIDTVVAGGSGTLVIDSITDLSWLQVGDYRAIYTISSKVTDAVPTNDTIMHNFNINDNTYASKVDITTVNGKPYASRAIFPGGASFSAIEYGSMFRFPNAATNNLSIDSISFTYYTSNSYTGNSTQSIITNIYEWSDNDLNGVPTDVSELTQIGVGVATLNGLAAGNGYGYATVTNLIDPGSGNAMVPLQNNKYYFISLLMNPSLLGGPATFNSTDMIWYGASELQNYYLNGSKISSPDNRNAVSSPIIVTDGGGTSNFYWTGFGMDVSPSIGVHLSGCSAVSSTDIVTACDSLTWIDGNTYYSNNNIATYNLTSSSGCDSVVTLNLTINTVDISVTNNSPTLTANESGATYRWLDCDNNYAVIPSETGQSYTASANGNYAVEVTINGCTDTSACENVTGVGINENSTDNILVYPVPAHENLTVSGLNFTNGFIVELMNNIGQIIVSNVYTNENRININLSNINQGTYQLVIKGNNNVITKTITVIR